MMTIAGHKILKPVAVLLCIAGTCLADDKVRHAAERDFAVKVLPILKSKCFACHGDDADDMKGDFDIRSREAVLRGGESGEPSIIVGKPDDSPIYRAVRWEDGLEMPPKENDRLTDDQIELVGNWIKNGAPWPDEESQKKYREESRVAKTDEGIIVKTSGGLSEEWTYRRYQPDDLWAYQPVSVDLAALQLEPNHAAIDYFIRKQLDAANVASSSQSDPLTLIRRATFDLIGLPPSPEDISEFEKAWKSDSKAAWSGLIDRLLESPHYGERWGQHWLDVVRYSDTGGYSNDYERSNAWRYRDYVIRSFNNDKPYNEFIVEQIAGDELADESYRNRNGGDEEKVKQARLEGDYTAEEAEWIVATGFLRMGPWDNAMVEASEARHNYLDDVVNVVGQTFLSTTMRCVKCHDHKFDPIPTRDYYRLYAAFSGTQMAERRAPFLPSENLANFDEGKAHVQRMLDFAVVEKNRLVKKREDAARQWFQEQGLEYKTLEARNDLPDEEKPPRNVGLDHIDEGQLKVREQDEWIWTRRLERYEPMAQSVYNAAKVDLAWNGARKLRIDEKAGIKQGLESFILLGGALTAPGPMVGPGVLSAAGLSAASDSDDPYLLPDELNGRRLGLAKWIAHADNPLTARSIVNRIWQYHFGRGIAKNANNFGAKGAKPTHPELLDFLASDFVEHGWKMKRMHRMIMMTDVYQQSSRHVGLDKLQVDDPNNDLLAYFPPRRLTAEELRDAMLSSAGELDDTLGGLPVMPEINMEVALQPRMIQFSLAPAYQPSPTPEQRNRRTTYAYRVRGQADPFLEIFNLPNPNESCEFRDTASVTPQAFTLLNSDVVTDRSIAMAMRIERKSKDVATQIERAFVISLGREPTETERNRLSEYVEQMRQYHAKTEVEPVTYPQEITRSVVEEFSGKPFDYIEILPVFEDYKSDKKATDVTAETRALADLCLLLFNTNEFMYLR